MTLWVEQRLCLHKEHVNCRKVTKEGENEAMSEKKRKKKPTAVIAGFLEKKNKRKTMQVADKNKQCHKKQRSCYINLLAAMALPINLRIWQNKQTRLRWSNTLWCFLLCFVFRWTRSSLHLKAPAAALSCSVRLYLCNAINCPIRLKKKGVHAACVEQPDILGAAGSPIYPEKPVEGGQGEPVQQEQVTKGPIHSKTHRKRGNSPPDLQVAATTICWGSKQAGGWLDQRPPEAPSHLNCLNIPQYLFVDRNAENIRLQACKNLFRYLIYVRS